MARAGRVSGQHCDESASSCQVTFAQLVLAYEAAAVRVDRSRPRHVASETTGHTQTAATAAIIVTKGARSHPHLCRTTSVEVNALPNRARMVLPVALRRIVSGKLLASRLRRAWSVKTTHSVKPMSVRTRTLPQDRHPTVVAPA
jgi:hypothetical protein